MLCFMVRGQPCDVGKIQNLFFFSEGDSEGLKATINVHWHDEMVLSQVNGAASRYGDMGRGWLVCASELHHWREWFEDKPLKKIVGGGIIFRLYSSDLRRSMCHSVR